MNMLMKTPFTTQEFFAVFVRYNEAVFPLQILIFILGIAGLMLIHARNPIKRKSIGILLVFLWLWMGSIYHIGFFSSINKAAYVFGGLFILEGLFICYEAYIRNKLAFRFQGHFANYLGYFFILFGLVIYPAISFALEKSLARTIALGLPCPSTILTFGFLMLADRKLPKYLLIIPSLWAVIGLSAAINFGVYQDFMMIVAAVLADVVLVRRKNIKNNEQ
jgi:hypothetical protein